MTETTLLPGAAHDQSAIEPPADVDGVEAGDRRRLMMIGGGAGVVVVAAAAYFLVFHKSSSDTPLTVPGVHPVSAASHRPAAAAGSKSNSGAVAKLPKPAKHVAAGRDPFKPLVVAPAAGSSVGSTTTVSGNSPAPAASTPAGTTTTTTTSNPTTPVVVQPTTAPSNGGPVTTKGTTGSPQWIQLVSTNGDKTATFKVGYAHHRFRRFVVHAPSASSTRGTVFDGEFALIGIQDGSVTLQVGDATPFDLPKGVERIV